MQRFGPNTVPLQQDQELNSNKSHAGLREKVYDLKRDKIGLKPFCFSGQYFCIVEFLYKENSYQNFLHANIIR